MPANNNSAVPAPASSSRASPLPQTGSLPSDMLSHAALTGDAAPNLLEKGKLLLMTIIFFPVMSWRHLLIWLAPQLLCL